MRSVHVFGVGLLGLVGLLGDGSAIGQQTATDQHERYRPQFPPAGTATLAAKAVLRLVAKGGLEDIAFLRGKAVLSWKDAVRVEGRAADKNFQLVSLDLEGTAPIFGEIKLRQSKAVGRSVGASPREDFPARTEIPVDFVVDLAIAPEFHRTFGKRVTFKNLGPAKMVASVNNVPPIGEVFTLEREVAYCGTTDAGVVTGGVLLKGSFVSFGEVIDKETR